MSVPGFADFVEGVANLGSAPCFGRYEGGETVLRCKEIVLSNRLPLEHMRGRDIQLLVIPGKHADESDAEYQGRLRGWTDCRFRQFGMKKLLYGKKVAGEEEDLNRRLKTPTPIRWTRFAGPNLDRAMGLSLGWCLLHRSLTRK